MSRALVMDEKDNVATVLEDVAPGASVAIEGGGSSRAIPAAQEIPFGHKIALADIPARAEILKYGEVIGIATQSIAQGSHVHVHNLKSARG